MGDDARGDEENVQGGNTAVHDVSLSLDAILSLLAHHQRRDLLEYLSGSSAPTATVEECVGHIVQREEARTGRRPGHDQVETALHHAHIPKLVDAGIVDYDARNREIRYWGNAELETWLDRIDEQAGPE